MATRYDGKYRRSPYPQAARINIKKHLTSCGTYHWEEVLASPQDNFLSLLGGTTIFTGRDISPPYFAH